MKRLHLLLRLLRDRNFLLLGSIVLGLAVGKAARWAEPLTLPALAVAMMVSVVQVSSDVFRSWRSVTRATLLSIALNYLILGTFTLLLARLLMPDLELWIGFVLVAAVPSGIAVIPFSFILGGDTAFALIGSVGIYLAALAIAPLLAWLLIGSSLLQPMRLVTILVELIAIPLLLSRLIRASRVRAWVEQWRGTIVNWAFALIIFTVVGLNRDTFLRQPQVLLLCLAVGLASNFALGLLLDRVMGKLRVEQAARISYVLMGTIKNTGLAAATALTFFGERVSVPAAVVSATNVLYLLWLGRKSSKS